MWKKKHHRILRSRRMLIGTFVNRTWYHVKHHLKTILSFVVSLICCINSFSHKQHERAKWTHTHTHSTPKTCLMFVYLVRFALCLFYLGFVFFWQFFCTAPCINKPNIGTISSAYIGFTVYQNLNEQSLIEGGWFKVMPLSA